MPIVSRERFYYGQTGVGHVYVEYVLDDGRKNHFHLRAVDEAEADQLLIDYEVTALSKFAKDDAFEARELGITGDYKTATKAEVEARYITQGLYTRDISEAYADLKKVMPQTNRQLSDLGFNSKEIGQIQDRWTRLLVNKDTLDGYEAVR